MPDLTHLVPFPVASMLTETPSQLVATVNFRKRLRHERDAVAILATLLPRERVADFDWLRAGVSDGGEGAGRTWTYRLRVPKKTVDAVAPRGVPAAAHAALHSSACAAIQTPASTDTAQ